jgi:hypothetical protein
MSLVSAQITSQFGNMQVSISATGAGNSNYSIFNTEIGNVFQLSLQDVIDIQSAITELNTVVAPIETSLPVTAVASAV